jgi:hypothetical protein
MPDKIALKRLSRSDLTFFEWQFRNQNAGNQKSINLNADVFVTELYPTVPSIALTNGNEIPVSMSLFGPGIKPEHRLARKIIKGSAYKNWRLNGEFVPNPIGDPTRYNSLTPGDLAVMEFSGDLQPTSLRIFLLSSSVPIDVPVHDALAPLLVGRSMVSITKASLETAISTSGVVAEHPLNELMIDAAIEDAALGGEQGMRTLLRRSSGRRLTHFDLMKARENAENTGQLGEELINDYLESLVEAGHFTDLNWTSADNAVAPYDFRVTQSNSEVQKIDVKSTSGEFHVAIHISMNELREAATCPERYGIYRIYGLDVVGGSLRIADDIRDFARTVIASLGRLSAGVTPDGFSVDPRVLPFGGEIKILFPDETEQM